MEISTILILVFLFVIASSLSRLAWKIEAFERQDVFWERARAIDEVEAAYYRARLSFGSAANMARSGELHMGTVGPEIRDSDDPTTLFEKAFAKVTLAVDEQIENDAWRNLMKMHISQLSSIWSASHDFPKSNGLTEDQIFKLERRANAVIATIVNGNLQSFARFSGHHYSDYELFDRVRDLISAEKSFAAELAHEDLDDVEPEDA